MIRRAGFGYGWSLMIGGVHLLDGGGVAGERAGDQVHQAGLADTGGAGHQQSQRLIRLRPEPLGLAPSNEHSCPCRWKSTG